MWIASQRTRFQLKKSRVAIALNPMTATIQASAMPRRQGAATDSPAGQLAWNSELFMGFGGEGVGAVDRDRFLTHVMMYWLTATAGSSAREYYEDARTGAGY